jgi:hypothetical protein
MPARHPHPIRPGGFLASAGPASHPCLLPGLVLGIDELVYRLATAACTAQTRQRPALLRPWLLRKSRPAWPADNFPGLHLASSATS